MNHRELPNAKIGYYLGIASIPLCFCTFIGVGIGIAGYFLSNGAIKTFEAEPDTYAADDYQKAQQGKKFSTIGIILGVVALVLGIIVQLAGFATNGF